MRQTPTRVIQTDDLWTQGSKGPHTHRPHSLKTHVGGAIGSDKQDPVNQIRKEDHSVSCYLSEVIHHTQH